MVAGATATVFASGNWSFRSSPSSSASRSPSVTCRGTSKCAAAISLSGKKIEHRLFSFITQNWRGKPLITHQVIVNLIAAKATKTGLRVKSRIDARIYAKGRRVSDKELALVNLVPNAFHSEWNYAIHPTPAQ